MIHRSFLVAVAVSAFAVSAASTTPPVHAARWESTLPSSGSPASQKAMTAAQIQAWVPVMRTIGRGYRVVQRALSEVNHRLTIAELDGRSARAIFTTARRMALHAATSYGNTRLSRLIEKASRFYREGTILFLAACRNRSQLTATQAVLLLDKGILYFNQARAQLDPLAGTLSVGNG